MKYIKFHQILYHFHFKLFSRSKKQALNINFKNIVILKKNLDIALYLYVNEQPTVIKINYKTPKMRSK